MWYYVRNFLEQLFSPIRTLLMSPGQLFSSGKRLFGVSLPARVAIASWFVLVLCVTVWVVAYSRAADRPFFEAIFDPLYRPVVVLVLVFGIPVVIYKALKAWLEGDTSPFEDIEKAFNAGLEEVARHGLDIGQIPVFLVLGSPGEQQEEVLMDASGLSFNVRAFPRGPAALHWYANSEGIFIAATNVGCLSRLAALGRTGIAEDKSQPKPQAAQPARDMLRGTIVAGEGGFMNPVPEAPSPPPSEPKPSPVGDIRGTMVFSAGGSEFQEDLGASAATAPEPKRPITLNSDDGILQDRRLEYLCQLICRTRQPICPINGILSLLPFGLILRGPREGVELQRVVRRDLTTLSGVFQLRCSVLAAVVGMEQEPGFQELVRRVGQERAARQRFGHRFGLTNLPIPERLEALCAHACGAFEDWVYALFREKGSLSKPGNTRLYSLLCKIRRDVQRRLGNILVSGYAHDPDSAEVSRPIEPLFFSGCYFASVGETADRQAFARGVFEKLMEDQGELQWTRQALQRDAKCQNWAHWVLGLDFVLGVALLALLVYAWVT
jgi:hypothetical protein